MDDDGNSFNLTGKIIWIFILILLSAFFSASEMSFSASSKSRLKTLSQGGINSKNAKTAYELMEDFNTLLSTLLVGNNIVNIAASSIATVIFTHYMGPGGATAATVVTTLLILTFGEITPKTIANDSPEKIAMASAPVFKVLNMIFLPINFLFGLWKKLLNKIVRSGKSKNYTEEELINIIEEAESDGSIDEQESILIRSAIEFNDENAEDILTPRVDIVSASDTAGTDEISEIFRNQRFSRVPVYHENIDNIVGILHEKDFNNMLYEGKKDISLILRKVVYVPEKMKISKLLRTMQLSKVHMAIVVDEFGGTSGIVTLEDVLEGLVGEIWDEHDEVTEDCRKVAENTYIISCGAPFGDLSETLGFANGTDDFSTIGGWVLNELGKIPETGDAFDYQNLHVVVTKTDNRRALEIKVTATPEKENKEDGKE